jgi:hypothetical protein
MQVILFSIFLVLESTIIFDFDQNSDISNWYVVDDVVMGGRSGGSFEIGPEGYAIFSGEVSLENNGGFSSVRYNLRKMDVTPYSSIAIRLKGDGKQYQFRVKSDRYERWSYINQFQTKGEWETIEIPLEDLYPSFRGMKLDRPNFSGEKIEEIAFLIGNKKAETFRLELDSIVLR